MIKRVNALKARQNLGQLLEQVYYKGDQYIIERAGRPLAAVVPLWQLEARKERRERVFGMIEQVWRKTSKVRPEVIEGEVEAAIRAVRSRPPRKKT